MSAIRMVAYGVLIVPDFEPSLPTFSDDVQHEANSSRAELIGLIRAELREYGMTMGPLVKISDRKGRVGRDWVVRRIVPSSVFGAQLVVGSGSLRECCLGVLKYIEPFNPALNGAPDD